jgi:hypothetical protein
MGGGDGSVTSRQSLQCDSQAVTRTSSRSQSSGLRAANGFSVPVYKHSLSRPTLTLTHTRDVGFSFPLQVL